MINPTTLLQYRLAYSKVMIEHPSPVPASNYKIPIQPRSSQHLLIFRMMLLNTFPR